MGLIFQRESRIPVRVSGRTVYTENEIRGHPNDFFIVYYALLFKSEIWGFSCFEFELRTIELSN